MKLARILREIEEEQPQPQQPSESKSGLKYDCVYVNGGFNDGVKIEPTDGGKINLSISIYGGGDPKSMNIPAKGKFGELIKSYGTAVTNNDQMGTELEPEIDKNIQLLQESLSLRVIEALKQFDQQIKQIIIETLKEK
jgi:hypothetical protein